LVKKKSGRKSVLKYINSSLNNDHWKSEEYTERYSWICGSNEDFLYLESSKILIYLVNISEFDNNLRESLLAFQYVVNHPQLELVCVLFNFIDLFREKINKIDLKCCFPDYKDGLNFDQAISYLKTTFNARNINRTEIMFQQTCAIDENSLKTAIEPILRSIILEKHEGQSEKIIKESEYFKNLYEKINSDNNYDISEAILELEIVLRLDTNYKLFIDNNGAQIFIKAIKELKPNFKLQSLVRNSLTKIYLKIAEKYQFTSEEVELLEKIGLKEKQKLLQSNSKKSYHKEEKKTHHRHHHKDEKDNEKKHNSKEKEKKSHHHHHHKDEKDKNKEEKKSHHHHHHKDEKDKRSHHKSRHHKDDSEKEKKHKHHHKRDKSAPKEKEKDLEPTGPMYLTVESGYKGLQGKRPTMEDAHVVFNNFSDIPDCKFEKKRRNLGCLRWTWRL